MPIHTIQPSFAGGEFAPSLRSRVDLQKYATGCKTLENFFVHSHGGISNRQGMEYIATTKGTNPVRIIPFEYSTEQAYVLEFGNQYIRFYKDGTQILSGGVAYEIATVFTHTELFDIKFTQSADVLYLAHPSHPPQKLIRYSDTSWAISDFDYENGPFLIENVDDTWTLTPSATTGNGINLVSTDDLFDAGHVGALFQIVHQVNGQSASGSYAGTGTIQNLIGSFAAAGESTTISCLGSWTLLIGGVYTGQIILQESADNGVTWTTTYSYPADGTGPITGIELTNVMFKVVCTLHTGGNATYDMVCSQSVGYKSSSVSARSTWRLITHGVWTGKIHLEKTTDGGATWETYRSYSSVDDYNVNITGTETETCLLRVNAYNWTSGIIYYDLFIDPYTHYGIVEIATVVDARNATANVKTDLAATTATYYWSEGAWSDYRGYPSCVSFYQDRLCFSKSITVWMSQTGDYNNFGISSPLADTDRVTLSLIARKVNNIKNMFFLGNLVALTSSSEWSISATNGVVTPSTVQTKCEGYIGADNIEPVIIGNRAVYVQAQGSVVRDIGYTFESEGYTGDDLSLYGYHLLKGYTIVEMAYQQEPDSIIWIVRDDGILLGLTYMKEQQVLAWHKHETEGEYESICCIPGDGYDEVWCVVNRSGTRYVERFVERLSSTEPEDQFFVDCGKIVTNIPASATLTGLTHLEGKTVAILADGNVFPQQVVSGGSLTLTSAVAKAVVGLPYESTFVSLKIDYPTNKGTLQSQMVQIPKVIVDFENSRGGYIGPDEATADEVIQRSTEVWGAPIALQTGDYEAFMSSDYKRGGQVAIVQKDPLPMTILSIKPVANQGG